MNASRHTHLVAILVLSLAGSTAFSQDQTKAEDYREVGKKFVSAKFGANREALLNVLASEVILLDGHEYLKKEYGISPTGDRTKPVTVKRDTLVDLDVKTYSQFPKEKMDKIRQLMVQADYRFLTSSQDGMNFDPWTQEVGGKRARSLPTKKGDVVMVWLVKPQQPQGDYLLCVIRNIDGAWKIVMDYTD